MPPAHSCSAPERDTGTTEQAVVLLLDDKGVVLDRMTFTGSSDRVALPVRRIVFRALQSECRGMVLIHNHPSGESTPSPEDVEVTRMLDRVLMPLDIRLIDHVIEAAGETFSFRANGLL